MQVFKGFLLCFQRKNVNLQKNVERFNVKVMAATVLNSTQVHLLQMFQVDDSQKGLEELKELLYSYYSKKMDESLNELWNSGVLDQKRLDEINNMDLHKLDRITNVNLVKGVSINKNVVRKRTKTERSE